MVAVERLFNYTKLPVEKNYFNFKKEEKKIKKRITKPLEEAL